MKYFISVLPRQPASQRGRKRHRRSGKGGPGLVVSREKARCQGGGKGDGERGVSQPPTIASRAKIRAPRPYAPGAVDARDCRLRHRQIPQSVRDFAPPFRSRKRRFCASVSAPGVCAPPTRHRSAGAIADASCGESAFTAHGVLYAGQLIGC